MKLALQSAVIAAAALLAAGGGAAVSAADSGSEPQDTSAAFDWGWVYGSMTRLNRDSDPFPWNDPLETAHLADRIAAMFSLRLRGGGGVFMKGATGAAGETSASVRGNFALEQGHVLLEARPASALFFSRERVFRSSGRLLTLVSSDAPLLSGGGDGFVLRLEPLGPLSVSYTGAALGRDRTAAGLPVSGDGGDRLNLVSIDLEKGRWHAGLLFSDTRSRDGGEAVLFGLGCGIPLGGAVCVAEYARSAEGTWSDLGRERLLGIEARRIKPWRTSQSLSDEAALGIEILGLEFAAERIGRFGLVPGYRHAGGRLINRQGETPPGVVESYLVCWWRHPELAAMLTAEAADRYFAATGEDAGVFTAALQARLRGGLQTRQALMLRAGRRSTLICSVLDENTLTRVAASARLDDLGEANLFSYLAEAAINLGRGVTLGGTLLLERSAKGYYSVDLEMRGGRRFFARASFGSYVPLAEYVEINYGTRPPAVEGQRFVALQTRLAFGGI